MNIHVRPTDENQFQEILDTLRPLGVELVTAEDDPLVAALFYVARMNSKLDNLGQLRHLNKVQKAICAVSDKAEMVLADEIRSRNTQVEYRKFVYRYLKNKTGHDPIKDLHIPVSPEYLTETQISDLFVNAEMDKE